MINYSPRQLLWQFELNHALSYLEVIQESSRAHPVYDHVCAHKALDQRLLKSLPSWMHIHVLSFRALYKNVLMSDNLIHVVWLPTLQTM